uniref:Large ribosomal subunit protein bL20c n=1 Tax=Cryptoglena skujai TaxID=161229 RepID=A0A0G3SFM3_9EUGL|nr:ribosomal protein L20 [Cryptoglena skujai]AKL39051.1 ribosomal protein L20 [Cryptoglena skujai]
MTRTKRGSVARKRRGKIFSFTKGYVGSHSKLFATSNQQYLKALRYSFSDRRKNKNVFRKLWIQRINAYIKTKNLKYSNFIHSLHKQKILLNRKVLCKITQIDSKTLTR